MSAAYFAERREFDRLQSWRPGTLAEWHEHMGEASRLMKLSRRTATQNGLLEHHVLAAASARMMHTVDDTARVAAHEASHAVVSDGFGFIVHGLQIGLEPSQGGGWRVGVCHVEGCPQDDAELLRKRIAGLCAGRAAERFACGASLSESDVNNSDRAQAWRYAAVLAKLTGRTPFDEFYYGVSLARNLIPGCWSKIVRVQAALLQKNVLDETEIEALIQES